MLENVTLEIVRSWQNRTGNVNSTKDILAWITELNENTHVKIEECNILDSKFWFFDDYAGEVLNRRKSFFSIIGMRHFVDDEFIREQPVIIQPEIGYLGIICRKIDGVLNFLMQAKIEPGNVNCVQISPTIQATKSNFLRMHGGKLPTYFELFEKSGEHQVLYDQIQSEQASRFYQKRNRNMIMYLDEDIELYPNFRWMTLGQIKELMKIDNLVNMDTRTVLSGLPLTGAVDDLDSLKEIVAAFSDPALCASIFAYDPQKGLPEIYQQLNNYKMFRDVRVATVPLNQLVDWKVDNYGITCRSEADFMVRYYNIEIDGREVQQWTQPLFKAIGMATFGLLSRVHNDRRKYLVRIKPEIGSFDMAELGPAIQWEPTHDHTEDNEVDKLFLSKYQKGEGVKVDVVLSEEGGRFYHEQNRNVIIYIDEDELPEVPDGYIWTDYAALGYMVQINNCLNIQLRNLMSLIDL